MDEDMVDLVKNEEEWLSLPEAAGYLCEVLNNNITEARILKFSMDGTLRLSLYLPHTVTAQFTQAVPEEIEGKIKYSTSIDSGPIQGVWDLPIFGGSYNEIKRRYNILKGIETPDTEPKTGVTVISEDGRQMRYISTANFPRVSFLVVRTKELIEWVKENPALLDLPEQQSENDVSDKQTPTANIQNYFTLTGNYWRVRFNSGLEVMIINSLPIRILLEYLKYPNLKRSRGKVYMSQKGNHPDDDHDDLTHNNDNLGSIGTGDLNNDATKVLSEKDKNILEGTFQAMKTEIDHYERDGEPLSAKKKREDFQKAKAILKKEYGATVTDEGEIINRNLTVKGKDRASENTKKNLDKAVKILSHVVGLPEHLEKYLLNNKDIYQPPEDFPEWTVTS